MSREDLGHFELLVLLAILRVGEDAYGVPIAQAIEDATERGVLVGSVYAALERLVSKGLVEATMGEPTPERGGRAKKYFSVTAKGIRQVNDARRSLTTLWKGLPASQGVA